MASVNDVCRLCLSKDNLVWVFDRRFDGDNMKDVIYITTGVEVHQKDPISQRICKQCCQISVKMYQFRNASQKNDQKLKEQYKEILKTSPVKYKIPNTSVTIKAEMKAEQKVETKAAKPTYMVHPSVANLFKEYPKLKVPAICLKADIAPCVAMEMNGVEEYMKQQNKTQQKCVTVSKNEKTIAKKSTSASVKGQSSCSTASIVFDPLQLSLSINNVDKHNDNDCSNKNNQKMNDFKIVNVSEIVGDKQRKDNPCQDDELDDSEIIAIKSRKRRLTDSDFFSDSETRDSFSSEPPPTKKTIGESSDGLCLDKSVPLYMCRICNSVHNNSKELRRHQFKHLVCQFCKSKFRTMSAKEAHVNSSCSIKNMMNNLPSVELKKIELDVTVRNKYPDAFQDLPTIPGLQLQSSSPERISEADGAKIAEGNDDDDVIEILSDDDDNVISFQPKTETSLNDKEKGASPDLQKAAVIQGPSKESTVIETVPKGTVSSITAPSIPPPPITASSVIAPPIAVPSFTPSSLIKPDIKIKNSNVLDSLDPKLTDIKILKELLLKHTSTQLTKEGSTQTDMPSNKAIHVNESSNHAELKQLKSMLYGYNVPVKIRSGTFQVAYDHDPVSRQRSPKKLCLWSDLTPIDVRRADWSPSHQGSLQRSVNLNGPNVANAGIASPNIVTAAITSPNYVNAEIISPQFVNTRSSPSNPVASDISLPNLNALISPRSFVSVGTTSSINATAENTTAPMNHLFTIQPNQRVNSFVRLPDRNNGHTSVPRFQFRQTTSSSVPSNPVGNNAGSVPYLTYVRPRTNQTEQQIRSPPPSTGVKSLDMRGPPNINVFAMPDVASPAASRNSMNTVPDISNSHSMIYNLQQNLSVTQKKTTEPPTTPLYPTTASDSNRSGPMLGVIRVKTMKELT